MIAPVCTCRIPAGASQLDAEDWDTGAAVTIPLDTTLTPMEVAEGLYKRARKLRRAVDAVQPLLEAAQQELEYLESVCACLTGTCKCREDACV